MSTKIEWVKSPDGTQGKTWNPITGCSHAGSPGCDMCYARRMARRLAGRYGYPEYPNHFDVTLHPDRLDIPAKRKKSTVYFVCSMSDLFHEDVPDDFIIDIFVRMGEAHQHTYQILTKRPGRMCDFISKSTWGITPLPNVYLGVSVENQAAADERIPLLLQTPAAVRFVSCEPLLNRISLFHYLRCPVCGMHDWDSNKFQAGHLHVRGLDWVIVGGESGPGARPMNPNWARDIRDQCQEAGVPFFFKQWGAWFPRSQWEGNPNLTLPDDHCCAESSRLKIMGDEITHSVGKKRAGRLLDGREHNELPSISPPRT